MSTKAKTAAKLVASIKKSKTGAVASKTSDRPSARETAGRSRASSESAAPAAIRSSGDFSHGQRVWPD